MTMSHTCKQVHLLGGHCRSEVRLYVRVHSPVENAAIRKDAGGDGNYGSSRDGGMRSHKGFDLATNVGQKVFSPLSGTITKIGWANKTHRYVEITGVTEMKDLAGAVLPGEKCIVRVMYVTPSVQKGKSVKAGDLIGAADDVHRNKQYSEKVGQHVHVEVRVGEVNINPEHIIPAGG